MNNTYSIQIQHFRTGVWTHNCTHVTTASAEQVQQEFEQQYKMPVRVVKVSEQEVNAIRDEMYNSIVPKQFR